MGRQRSGRLSNERVWQRTPRPRRRCGVSNGSQRQEGTKDLQQQARIAASPFIGKLREADADNHRLPSKNVIARMVSVQTRLLRHLASPLWIRGIITN